MEQGLCTKQFLLAWPASWTTRPIFRLQFFASFAIYLCTYSADALRPPEAVVDNVLSPGTEMYGDRHSPESHLVAGLLSVHDAPRPSSGARTDFRRRETNGVQMPAFIGEKEAEKTADLADPEDEEEGGGEEEEGEEEGPDEDTAEKQGTPPSSTTSEGSSELKGDQIIGGVVKEDGNNSETVDKTGSSEGKTDTHHSEKTMEEKSVHEERAEETKEGVAAPPSAGEKQEDDEDTKQNGKKSTEEDEKPAHPKEESPADKGDGNDKDAGEFRIQFSFKPDLVIPSELRSKVHQTEVEDSDGHKWYQVASSTAPQLLKVESSEAGTVYHRPAVNYA